MKPGTFDFYYDIGDRLTELGVEFALVVRQPGEKSNITLHNVEREDSAREMVISLDGVFRARFSPNQEEDDSDDPNTAPEI